MRVLGFHNFYHVCENVNMTTKTSVNVVLDIIGDNGLSGIEVLAHSLSAAIDRICPADFDAPLRVRVTAELQRQSLIEVTRHHNKFQLQLSVKGIHRLQRAQVERVSIPRPDTWDGKWRMVTYDVPRAQSAQRRLFARQLERLGFTMIRESVWFHPHPCFSQVESIIGYCGLQRHVTLAEISRIDNVSLGKLKRAYPGL